MNIFKKKFCKRLGCYTNGNIKLNIIWETKTLFQIETLFKSKGNVKYLTCFIHQGI